MKCRHLQWAFLFLSLDCCVFTSVFVVEKHIFTIFSFLGKNAYVRLVLKAFLVSQACSHIFVQDDRRRLEEESSIHSNADIKKATLLASMP